MARSSEPDRLIACVLGPCRVEGLDGPPLSSTQRRIVSRMALDAPGLVALADLSEAVWGDAPPATARAALQNQISRLRGRLGAEAIVTVGDAYTLALPVDAALAADRLGSAEAAMRRNEAEQAYELAAATLDFWRGRPVDELDDLPIARRARILLQAVARGLEDVRLEASIALGRSGWAVAEAERLVAIDPRDEHRWALLVAALAAAGRRGAALAAAERARRALADDLGLGPGPELRAAEAAVLAVDQVRDDVTPRPVIGREAEIEEVLASLGRHSITLLVGEAGSGKTAVLGEIGRHLRRRGHREAAATCAAHPASPIATLVDLLDGLAIVPDDHLAPVVRFVDAVRRDVTERGTLTLAVDGLDRAGPTTAAAVTAASAIEGVALVATADEVLDLGAGTEVSTVTLRPLGAEAVGELAAGLLGAGRSVAPSDAGWLTAMSGGNPVLLTSLLDDPEVRRRLVGTHDAPDLLAVTGLREVVRRRIDRLGAAARDALQMAAVCGPIVSIELLSSLADPGGIDEAVADGLLVFDADDGERLCFRHGAVQQVLADDLPPGHRVEAHHRAATVLAELVAPAASVATHAIAAAEVDPTSAYAWALRAAAAATAHGAHADAAQWCERALAVAATGSSLDERARVEALIRRGDALRLLGSTDQETALFEAADAATALGDADLIGEAAFAALQLGATTESGSMHERAVLLAEHALSVVTDSDAWAGIAAAASLMYSMTGRPERCRDLFVAAEDRADSSAARRHVLPFAFLALGHPADLDRRETIARELLRLSTAAQDPVAGFEAHQLLMSVAVQRGDGGLARRSVDELDGLLPQVGDVGRRWALAYLRAAVAHLDGDLVASEELAELALATFVDVSPSRAFATYSAQLLPLRLSAGRLGELTDQLEALVADQPEVPAWHAALALCLAPVDVERASVHAASALDDVPLDFTWLAAHLIGGRAAAEIGDRPLARRYIDRLQRWSGLVCWAGTCSYGPVDAVLALLARSLGEVEQAAEHAGAARATASRLGAPVFIDELDRLFG